MRLPLREIQDHLSKEAVSPCEPRSGVVSAIVDVDTLMDESETISILKRELATRQSQSYAETGEGFTLAIV
jgi:hypothetical protein